MSKKKAVTLIAVFAAFSIKLRQGFAPPVQNPGDMVGGAMNDPFAVIVSGIMAAVVVWAVSIQRFTSACVQPKKYAASRTVAGP